MSKKRRALFLVLICLSMLFLIGAEKKLLELRDDNILIDLQKAIENVRIGNQGNAEKKNPTPNVTPMPTTVPSKTYLVLVEDTRIEWNGTACADINSLEYKLKSCTNKDKIILSGNYAEAHAYREVEQLLDKYANEKKITVEKKPIE